MSAPARSPASRPTLTAPTSAESWWICTPGAAVNATSRSWCGCPAPAPSLCTARTIAVGTPNATGAADVAVSGPGLCSVVSVASSSPVAQTPGTAGVGVEPPRAGRVVADIHRKRISGSTCPDPGLVHRRVLWPPVDVNAPVARRAGCTWGDNEGFSRWVGQCDLSGGTPVRSRIDRDAFTDSGAVDKDDLQLLC